jgi:hypothetical protein
MHRFRQSGVDLNSRGENFFLCPVAASWSLRCIAFSDLHCQPHAPQIFPHQFDPIRTVNMSRIRNFTVKNSILQVLLETKN